MAQQALEYRPSDINPAGSASSGGIADMQQYFGPLRNADIDTIAADRFAHETHNLPKAYEGRNKFLIATIDFLITKDDDWYTRVILPWEFTEELHVQWNIWRFNKTMMDYEPHQGVPRYVTQESETHGDSLVRRGLAFIIEHGFYQTELGRQHYLMNLRQIVEAVHETVYFGVIHTLLSADNYYKQWQMDHGVMTSSNLTRLMEDSKLQWACVQKDIKGLYVLDAELKDRMRRQGIEPSAWIFPSKMAIYASMVPDYMTEFMRRGPSAPEALEKGASKFNTFRGLPVYETRPFDVDFIGGTQIEPMVKESQIGEYYVFDMTNPHPDKGIEIFNMDTDRFTQINMKTILDNSIAGPKFENADPDCLYYSAMHAPSPIASAEEVAGGQSFPIHEFLEPNVNVSDLERAQYDARAGAGNELANAINRRVAAFIDTFDADQQRDCILGSREHSLFKSGWDSSQVAAADRAALGRYNAADNTAFDAGVPYSANGYDARAGGDILCNCIGGGSERSGYNPTIELLLYIHQNWNKRVIADNNVFNVLYQKFGIHVFGNKIILCRPFMSYRMGSAILCRSGTELGQTFHGHHDFQLTDDIIHKVHIGHYTFYSKSIVRSPKHMYIAENVFCTGYVSGENCKFITHENHIPNSTDSSRSIIAAPINTLRDSTELDNPLVLAENVAYPMSVARPLSTQDGSFSAQRAIECALQIQESLDHAYESSVQWHASDSKLTNAYMFEGCSRRPDGNGQFKNITVNTGHWGPNVYDGCGAVRRGAYMHLKDCEYYKVTQN